MDFRRTDPRAEGGDDRVDGRHRRLARGALWAAIALSALYWGAWSWWSGRPDRHLARAETLLGGGRPLSAAAWLALPERAPRTADRARLLRARIALETGRPEAAVAPLEEISPDGPLAAEAAYLKGRALLAAGNLPYALAWFQRSLRERPDDPECLRAMAVAAYDLGDLETVLRSLRTLTRLKPDDAPAWRTLGLVRMELPDAGEKATIEAADAYRTSLDLDPHQPQARLELADLLTRQGDYAGARRQLEACRGRVPEADHLSLLARVAWELGDRTGVTSLLDDAQRRGLRHPELLALRGLLAQAEGRLDDAVSWFDRAVEADPYNFRRYYQRATLLRVLGRLDDADRDSGRADELKRAVVEMSALNAEAADLPLDPGVRCRLGRLCERLGKPELAASWYRAALSCDPGHEEARAALDSLGR